MRDRAALRSQAASSRNRCLLTAIRNRPGKSRPNSLSSRQLRTFTPSAAKIVEALDLAIDLAEVGPKS
jgi:hypothetical protein